MCVTPLGVLGQILVHLRLNGRLQHLLGPLADQLVQRARLAKLGSKLQNLRIERACWTAELFCRKLPHGVSSVPSSGR